MAEKFYTILTAAGKAKIANAIPTGQKINLTKIKFGDSNGAYYEPTENQTDIKHMVYESNITTVSVDEKNPNWITLTSIIPPETGGFTIREIGVYDDTNTLIAIGKYPETYKPILDNGSTKELYVKMTIEVSNANGVELKVDPYIILATKGEINEVDKRLTSQLEQMAKKDDVARISSGTPLFASSTSEMSDITKNYVNTTDGYVYIYNGGNWIKTNVLYQATGIGKKSVKPSNLDVAYIKENYVNLAYQTDSFLTPNVSTTSVTYDCNLSNYISLDVGKYLIYIDFDFSYTNFVNGNFNVALFYGTGRILPTSDGQYVSLSFGNIKANNNICYAILNVTEKKNFRLSLFVSNLKTSITNQFTIKANKLFAIKIDSYKKELINSLNMYSYTDEIPLFNIANYDTSTTIDEKIALSKNDKVYDIDCYGDSLMNGVGDTNRTYAIYNYLKTKLGEKYNVRNLGVGGESSRTIASRQGGLCVMINNITIPKDGSSVIIGNSTDGLYADDGEKVYPWIQGYGGSRPLYINGIECDLYYNSYNDKLYRINFKTQQETDMVINRPTPILTDNMVNHRNKILIIWIGQNGGYIDVDDWINQIKKMIDYNGNNKYIVLGRTSQGNNDISVETRFFKEFGRHYINLRKYLTEYGLSDANIIATDDDNTDISEGRVPRSLRLSSTDVHFNSSGQKVISELVYKKGKELLLW